MGTYVIRRLLLMVPTVIGVAILVFVVLRFTPGDVADLLLAETLAENDPAAEQRIREDLGLSGSMITQLGRWFSNLARGDLGASYYSGRSVAEDLWQRLIVSFELGVLAMLISIAVGVPVGVISALKQDSWIDYVLRGGSIFLLAMPAFWTAILVLILGLQWFNWAPPARYVDLWKDPLGNLYMLAIPALILGINLSTTQMRFTRAQLLEVMRQDYIRTAWAKGLRSQSVVVRHALKNALIPVVTVIGLQVPAAITGTVILETIFVIPGVGRFLVDAARRADYPIVQAVTLVVAVAVVTANFLVDLSYAYLDPRTREGLR
ncbi:MAG: ABC transporter permease [Dehalococcoidia bacterium]